MKKLMKERGRKGRGFGIFSLLIRLPGVALQLKNWTMTTSLVQPSYKIVFHRPRCHFSLILRSCESHNAGYLAEPPRVSAQNGGSRGVAPQTKLRSRRWRIESRGTAPSTPEKGVTPTNIPASTTLFRMNSSSSSSKPPRLDNPYLHDALGRHPRDHARRLPRTINSSPTPSPHLTPRPTLHPPHL